MSVKVKHLTALEFSDDGFSYRRRSYTYQSITAISFDAVHTKHYVNSVPTGSSYNAELILHLANGIGLDIKQPWAYFSGTQKAIVEAMWKANEIFSELTFDQRIEKYESQLRAKEFFAYGRYQFRRGGDLFKDCRLLFNIKKDGVSVLLRPSSISFVTKKTLAQKLASLFVNFEENIDIRRDRDCFLYMYKLAFGQFWPTEQYRERRANRT